MIYKKFINIFFKTFILGPVNTEELISLKVEILLCRFNHFNSAEEYLNDLLNTYHQKANTKECIIHSLAKILDSLNFFHPFREGNGRTQREVIRVLAISKGYRAQIRVSDDDIIYNTYMDGTVYGDLQKLENLFELILEKI